MHMEWMGRRDRFAMVLFELCVVHQYGARYVSVWAPYMYKLSYPTPPASAEMCEPYSGSSMPHLICTLPVTTTTQMKGWP